MTLSVLFCLCFEINAEKEIGKLLLTSMQYFHSTPVDKIVYHNFFYKYLKYVVQMHLLYLDKHFFSLKFFSMIKVL